VAGGRRRHGAARASNATRIDLGTNRLDFAATRHAGAPPDRFRSRVLLQRFKTRGTHDFSRKLVTEAALYCTPSPATMRAAPTLLPQAVPRDDDAAAACQAFTPPWSNTRLVWLKRTKTNVQHHLNGCRPVDPYRRNGIIPTASALPPAGTAWIRDKGLDPGGVQERARRQPPSTNFA